MTEIWLFVMILIRPAHGYAMDTMRVANYEQCQEYGEQWIKQMRLVTGEGSFMSTNVVRNAEFKCVRLESKK